jgi:hypothetical protein
MKLEVLGGHLTALPRNPGVFPSSRDSLQNFTSCVGTKAHMQLGRTKNMPSRKQSQRGATKFERAKLKTKDLGG